tara:strand:- start:14664 stop:14891 length:228 start_codon:yes stop_codon:yes gene_type:complete
MGNILGYVQLKRWTPKIAAAAANRRIEKVQLLLQEIADLYGDVYQPVVTDCDIVRDQLDAIRESVREAEEAGAEL